MSNFGRQLTHSRHRALIFCGEASFWKKKSAWHMACDVDTGAVFKRPVHCFGCGQAFYFTLRKIAEAKKLACPLCGSDIDLTDEAYGFVVTSVKETIASLTSSPRLQRISNVLPRGVTFLHRRTTFGHNSLFKKCGWLEPAEMKSPAMPAGMRSWRSCRRTLVKGEGRECRWVH